jgi:hypothetical protein
MYMEISDIFTHEELASLLQDPIVIAEKGLLSETRRKIRFSMELPENILTKIRGLGVSLKETVPMTWIAEDSAQHTDVGDGDFEKTVVVYVSPAIGSLILDNETFEIKEGRAFSFPKGVSHNTVGTGQEPRLLIGPMSEQGFPVGAVTIYYFANYSDVFPEPNLANVVYSMIPAVYPFIETVSDSNVFPDNSSIPPPYPGAVLDAWAGQTGYTGNYTPVYYSPGQILDNHIYDVFLYPLWTKVMCFKEGTQILCFDQTEKYLPIENLTPGTLVKTVSKGYQPIALIGHTKIYNPGHSLRAKNRLYRCSPKQYPELTEDLILTGCHSILVKDITQKHREETYELLGDIFVTDEHYRLLACIDERATPYEEEGVFTIWHFALEHEHMRANYGVYANGLLVETSSKRMMSEYSGMELYQ